MDKPRIVFCLPGDSFSGSFLDCWTNLIENVNANGIQHWVKRRSGSHVEHLRTACLDGVIIKGKDQEPFAGQIDYTHIVWIDSDQTFTFEDIIGLINRDLDIVSGVYATSNGANICAGVSFDYDYLEKNGTFKYMAPIDLQGKTNPIEIAFAGMGALVVKRGVFEKIGFPWFRQVAIKHKKIIGSFSEDLSFFINAAKAGFDIYLDPIVRFGHEKKLVLSCL